jgi:hypothetical protein
MVFSEINAFISIIDRIKGKISGNNDENDSEDNIADRVIRVFESHGVHKNQIPRFCDFDLTIADVQNKQALLKRLDERLLNFVCEKFVIRREWIDGASKQIYPIHDFYKKPEYFVKFLDDLLRNNTENRISGFLLTSDKKKENTVLLLEEELDRMETTSIYRYYLCDATTFHYWKSRAYTTACVAYAWRKKVFIHGHYLPQKEIDNIAGGERLLGWSGKGAWSLKGKKWYPEDMTIKPDSYLAGIDPERDNYGQKAALSLWLELEEQGYMDSGLGKNVRSSFTKKLNELR